MKNIFIPFFFIPFFFFSNLDEYNDYNRMIDLSVEKHLNYLQSIYENGYHQTIYFVDQNWNEIDLSRIKTSIRISSIDLSSKEIQKSLKQPIIVYRIFATLNKDVFTVELKNYSAKTKNRRYYLGVSSGLTTVTFNYSCEHNVWVFSSFRSS